jgi:3-dehydroquinate synthase
VEQLKVNLGSRSYPVYITTDFDSIGKTLEQAGIGNQIAIITDSNVDQLYSEECIKALRSGGYEVTKFVFEAGEKSKNLGVVKTIYDFLIKHRFDRDSTIIALGGGVTGDTAGFAAATFLRGINLVQVPTSLIAQADSSIGGKVGVDFGICKNLVGAFYQPKLVYANVNTLKTLPERELRSGLAEVIVHGIIKDAEFFQFMESNLPKVFGFDEATLRYVIKINCAIKGNVVEQDEKESGYRAILNFGHTIGHAIEGVYDFTMLHGECVSLGVVGAFKMAHYLGMIDETTVFRVVALLEKVGLPVRLPGIEVEKVYQQMFHDKKVKDNQLVFVLPKAIGTVELRAVEDPELIQKVIGELGS